MAAEPGTDGAAVAKRPAALVLPFIPQICHICAAEPPFGSPTAVARPVGLALRCSLCSVCGCFERQKGGRFFFFCFVLSSCRLKDLSHVSFILRLVCVWMGTLGLLPHYSVYKEMHTFATQGVGDDTSCSCVTLPSLFILCFLNASKRRDGDSGGGGVGRPSTLPHIRINHEFSTMPNVLCAVVQLLISLVFPSPSSLCTFSSLYLFKAEIYGLYQAWEGEANVAVNGNHRLFILQQYTCLLSRSVLSLFFFCFV